MKKLYIIAFFFAILTSCSSPERVAEKALKDFGNGLFASNIVGFSIEKNFMFLDHGDVYSDFLIESNEAENILNFGHKKDLDKDSYFMTDILFDDYILVSKEEYTRTLYDIAFISEKDSLLSSETIELLKEYDREKTNFYKEVNDYFLFKYDDIPYYVLKYKLDNKYLATIIVIKVPDKGYRVCAVWIH